MSYNRCLKTNVHGFILLALTILLLDVRVAHSNLRPTSCSHLVARQKQSNLIQCLSATCNVPEDKKFTEADEANACKDANQKFVKWGKSCVVKGKGLLGRKRDGKHAVCQGTRELPKFDLKRSKDGYTISGTGGQNAQCDERKDIQLKLNDMILVPIGREEARFTLDNVKAGSLEWHWRDESGTRRTASVQNALNHEGTRSHVFILRKNGAKEQLWDLWHCAQSSSAYGAAANEYDYGYDENDGWYDQDFGEDEYTEVGDGDDDDLEVELDEMLKEMFMAGYQKGLKGHR